CELRSNAMPAFSFKRSFEGDFRVADRFRMLRSVLMPAILAFPFEPGGVKYRLLHRSKTSSAGCQLTECDCWTYGRRLGRRMHHRAPLCVRADHVRCRSIAAHMVPPVLRIVFDRNDAGVRPIPAVADGCNDFSECEVVVGYLRFGFWGAISCAPGMIVREPENCP